MTQINPLQPPALDAPASALIDFSRTRFNEVYGSALTIDPSSYLRMCEAYAAGITDAAPPVGTFDEATSLAGYLLGMVDRPAYLAQQPVQRLRGTEG